MGFINRARERGREDKGAGRGVVRLTFNHVGFCGLCKLAKLTFTKLLTLPKFHFGPNSVGVGVGGEGCCSKCCPNTEVQLGGGGKIKVFASFLISYVLKDVPLKGTRNFISERERYSWAISVATALLSGFELTSGQVMACTCMSTPCHMPHVPQSYLS